MSLEIDGIRFVESSGLPDDAFLICSASKVWLFRNGEFVACETVAELNKRRPLGEEIENGDSKASK